MIAERLPYELTPLDRPIASDIRACGGICALIVKNLVVKALAVMTQEIWDK